MATWEKTKVKELFDVITGTTPSTQVKEFWEPEINWITPTDLSLGENRVYIQSTHRKISQKAQSKYNLKMLPTNSIVLSTRAPVGYVALVQVPATINQGCKGLVPKKDDLDPLFYVYYFKSIRKKLEFLSAGSTFKELSKETLENLSIPLPPLPEQRRIAEVLRTVDEAIEKVEREIGHTERLKRGLMQHLLTRGIGHTRFKDSPLGKIPESWEVMRLGDPRITTFTPNKVVSNYEMIAFIPMDKIPDSGIYATYEMRNKNEVKSGVYCEAGDLLLAKITPSLENGKQGVVPLDVPHGFAIATTEVFPIKCVGIDTLFCFYILKHHRFRGVLINSMIGTTGRQRVPKIAVSNLFIPLPPLPEQKKIAEILMTVDRKLDLLRQKKHYLERLKKGLMNDLLTGKRRLKYEYE